jgi:hypothetical protein
MPILGTGSVGNVDRISIRQPHGKTGNLKTGIEGKIIFYGRDAQIPCSRSPLQLHLYGCTSYLWFLSMIPALCHRSDV